MDLSTRYLAQVELIGETYQCVQGVVRCELSFGRQICVFQKLLGASSDRIVYSKGGVMVVITSFNVVSVCEVPWSSSQRRGIGLYVQQMDPRLCRSVSRMFGRVLEN